MNRLTKSQENEAKQLLNSTSLWLVGDLIQRSAKWLGISAGLWQIFFFIFCLMQVQASRPQADLAPPAGGL